MKSVIKGSYKGYVRARAGAKTFWKSEPERKKKFRLHNTGPEVRGDDIYIFDEYIWVDLLGLFDWLVGVTYGDDVRGDEIPPVEENGEDDKIPAHACQPVELGLYSPT